MSMMSTDFWCEDCQEIWLYSKVSIRHKFPERRAVCTKCGGRNTRRYWGKGKITGTIAAKKTDEKAVRQKTKDTIKEIQSTPEVKIVKG